VLPLAIFNFCRQQVNIVLAKVGICTLIDIVIVVQIYFLDLAPLKDLLPSMQFKPKKELLQPTPHRSIPPFSNWSIWMFTQNMLMCSYMSVPMLFGAWKGQKVVPFLFFLLFSLKFFNYIVKDEASFILSQAVVVGLATSWPPSLQNTPPITMVDWLQVIGC
jgi:hypothetical protein